MHTAVQKLPADIKSKLVAGVLFGDTLNQRNRHQIPGFPADRVKEFCASGDGICEVSFRGITAGHLGYSSNGMDTQAVEFLLAKLQGRPATGGEVTGGGKGSSSAPKMGGGAKAGGAKAGGAKVGAPKMGGGAPAPAVEG
jgi:hypothetical protein